MSGQWRTCALVVLFCALTTGCAADAGGGIRCDLPDDAHLVAAPDGGMHVEWANGFTTQLLFANGFCVANRPVFAATRPPITDEELDFTYDYYRQSLVPCLNNLGFPNPGPPSRESFVASHGNWSPYDTVFTSLLDSDEIATIAIVCPEAPPKH
jgi:hypothetical protein